MDLPVTKILAQPPHERRPDHCRADQKPRQALKGRGQGSGGLPDGEGRTPSGADESTRPTQIFNTQERSRLFSCQMPPKARSGYGPDKLPALRRPGLPMKVSGQYGVLFP